MLLGLRCVCVSRKAQASARARSRRLSVVRVCSSSYELVLLPLRRLYHQLCAIARLCVELCSSASVIFLVHVTPSSTHYSPRRYSFHLNSHLPLERIPTFMPIFTLPLALAFLPSIHAAPSNPLVNRALGSGTGSSGGASLTPQVWVRPQSPSPPPIHLLPLPADTYRHHRYHPYSSRYRHMHSHHLESQIGQLDCRRRHGFRHRHWHEGTHGRTTGWSRCRRCSCSCHNNINHY